MNNECKRAAERNNGHGKIEVQVKERKLASRLTQIKGNWLLREKLIQLAMSLATNYCKRAVFEE